MKREIRIKRHRGQLVLLIDLLITYACNFMYFLPELLKGDILPLNLSLHIGILAACILFFQLLLKTYNSLWRYAESHEYFILLAGTSLGYVLYFIINLIIGTNTIWVVRALSATAVALLLMLAFRFMYRDLRSSIMSQDVKKSKDTAGQRYVAIIGTSHVGISMLRELLDDKNSIYTPYCMLDDAIDKAGKSIMGVPVRGPIDDIVDILAGSPVTDIVFAISSMEETRKAELLRKCSGMEYKLHIVADGITQLESGKSAIAKGTRMVEIEDLLGRPPIELDNNLIANSINGKTLMVTGGAGSIGSELCRQIARNKPRRIVLVDLAENPAYILNRELTDIDAELEIIIEIASVREADKIDRLVERYRPEYIFHAAAHKHVPLMEHCPDEAVKNNVLGTYNTAVAASKYKVKKFVLISSDKAVNPTNVMGATKLLCEMILQSLRADSETEFVAVRFGNVLGSAGSVLPIFKQQLAHNGPLTITNKKIERYFMTISEAVQLVMEAGFFAKGGETFVLDMGEPVKILDLAENLIRLSGLTPYVDIDIVEVGMRPGEKLYEELFISDAKLRKTQNQMIYVLEEIAVDVKAVLEGVSALAETAKRGDNESVINQLHDMLPSFRKLEPVKRPVNTAQLPVCECRVPVLQ